MSCVILRLERPVAIFLVTLFIAPTIALAAPAPQTRFEGQAPAAVQQQGVGSPLPAAAPGNSQSTGIPQAATPAVPATNTLPPASQSIPQAQNSTSVPGGTAAAPYEKQEGITASEPAGAAIAPGKQRRIRTFAIRAALLLGAAVAIGVVVAASEGSPSRP
jgi:hypothetical protein